MKKTRNKWLIVLLALAMVLTVASSASAAAPDPIKTGFYVKDASKANEYTYYSLPYILADLNTFLTYKDNFTNDDDFIWVDSEEQFVSIADWDNGVAPITNIVTNLGSAAYYDAELGRTLDLALGVQATVSNPAKTGFNLSLSREVADLAAADLELKDSSNAVVGGLGLTNPTGDDITFQVTGSLTPGESYTLTIGKVGFYFGEAIDLEVPTEIIQLAGTPVTNPSKTGFTLNLSSPLAGLTAADFLLQDQYGNNVAITGANSGDGGNTYDFTAVLQGEESYTLSCPGDKYELSAPVSFTVPPTVVATNIENITVNDLVVKLNPGVDNIPSANFYLRDSNNQRLLSMILTNTSTDYKIGAFPYLVAGSQYSIEVHMKGYDFGAAQPVNPAQTNVTMNVGNQASTGFTVTMEPVVPGLNAGNFSLKNSQGNTVPFAVKTSDGGATYVFQSDIIAGSNYTITATRNGFNFGTAKNVLAPVKMIGAGGANGKIYVYLNGILNTLPAPGDFTITRSIDGAAQANPVPTNVSQNTTTRILTLDVSTINAIEKDQVVTGTVSYGGVSKSYTFTIPSSVAYVASQIKAEDITNPALNDTALALPTMPAGFSVTIYSSSNEEVIQTDGTIVPPQVDTTVAIVLQVTKDADSTTANTASFNVEVPGSPDAVVASITDIENPAPGATTLTLPDVPAAYTVAIKTSSNEAVIALNGTIAPPWEPKDVDITLEIEKNATGDKALTGTFTVNVPEAPAVTAINSANTAAAMQTALADSWLALDLDGFNALNTADKATVAQGVINARPVDGYRSNAALQAALDNAVDNVQDLNALNAAVAALTFNTIKGTNIHADAVTADLDLVATVTVDLGAGPVVVNVDSWSSNNTDVVAIDGTVTPPSFTAGDKTVILTANLSKGTQTATKQITVTITKLPQTETEAVAQLNAATNVAEMQTAITNPQLGLDLDGGYDLLNPAEQATVADSMLDDVPYLDKAAIQAALDNAVGSIADLNAVAAAKTALVIGYASGDSASSVTQNLTLATEQGGVTVSWSSDPAKITAAGIVTRPSFTEGNLQVTLTANLTKNAATDTKQFTVTLIKLPQTVEEAVAQLNAATSVAEMQTAITNVQLGLDLDGGYDLLNPADQATVADSMLDDIPYLDKAAIQAALDNTVGSIADLNAVAAAKTALVIGYASGDSASSVTQNLTLATEQGGVTVSWGSDKTAVIANDGSVSRPIFSEGDASVKLTATLTKGDASDTKEFNVTVVKQAPSTDASLSALTISQGTLTPVFNSETTGYTAAVNYEVNSLTVTPTVNESHAMVTVNGTAVVSGNASGAIDLDVGENTITVLVTAENGSTTKEYTINVTKADVPSVSVTAIDKTDTLGVFNLTAAGTTATAIESAITPDSTVVAITPLDVIDTNTANTYKLEGLGGKFAVRITLNSGNIADYSAVAVVGADTANPVTLSKNTTANAFYHTQIQAGAAAIEVVVTETATGKTQTYELPLQNGTPNQVDTSSNKYEVTITNAQYDITYTIEFKAGSGFTIASGVSNTVKWDGLPSSENDITAFSFEEQTGVALIDATNHTVSNIVENGTDLSNLVATFTLSQDATAKIGSIDQVSGVTANDFTHPVEYTVIAEDGTIQNWTVTVKPEVSVTAIDQTDTRGVFKLTAADTTASAIEAAIIPASTVVPVTVLNVIDTNTANTYKLEGLGGKYAVRITLSSGSIADYSAVAVVGGDIANPVALSKNTTANAFYHTQIQAGTASIVVVVNETATGKIQTYELPLQNGTPNQVDTGENKYEVTITNAEYDKTYAIQFKSGSEFVITTGVDNNVKWDSPPSSENDIIAFSFDEQTGAATIDANNHTVDIEVETDTDVTNLVATFSLSQDATAKVGSIDQLSGVTANDFDNPVVYTVIAEDGTLQDWTVTVTVKLGPLAVIDNSTASTYKLEGLGGKFAVKVTLTAPNIVSDFTAVAVVGADTASPVTLSVNTSANAFYHTQIQAGALPIVVIVTEKSTNRTQEYTLPVQNS